MEAVEFLRAEFAEHHLAKAKVACSNGLAGDFDQILSKLEGT